MEEEQQVVREGTKHTKYPILIWVIRILVSGLFLFSAVSKLLSIDSFELYSFKILPVNWYVSISLVRLLLAIEIFIAIGILSGIGFRVTTYTALIFIVLSSLWLIQRMWITPEENCYCFGELIEATPLVSLFKNLVLLVLLGMLSTQAKAVMHRFDKWIWVVLIFLIPYITVNIISPPDYLFQSRYTTEGHLKNINTKELFDDAFMTVGTSDNIPQSGIFMMISMNCPMCKMAVKKVSAIQQKKSKLLPITMVVLAKEIDGWLPFTKEHQVPNYPVWFILPENFMKYSRSVPAIYFVENSEVVKVRSYRDLTDKDFD